MSVLHLWVGDVVHDRIRRNGETACSCGRMSPAAGSAGGQANAWRAHVEAEAAAAGVAAVRSQDVTSRRPTYCPTCSWQGLRPTPSSDYAGPAGPCPKCGARLRAVGYRRVWEETT